jgi:group I intron endonuclease
MYYIYKITNTVNGKNYIGYTKNPKGRWASHKTEAKKLRSGQNIHKAMAKHGIDNFVFEIIFEHPDKDYVFRTMEDILIQEHKALGPYGYNMDPGGNGRSEISAETRQRMSEAKKGKVPWNKGLRGSTPWNKGLTKDDPRVAANVSAAHQSRKNYTPWNKGLTKEEAPQLSNSGVKKGNKPWNKGLTIE